MRLAAAAAFGLLALPSHAQDMGEPLSAIDWLSQSVGQTSAPTAPLDEPPVSDDASTPDIIVTPLGSTGREAEGALPPEATGLPADLWAQSDMEALADLIRTEQATTLPALQELLVKLMLTDAAPPEGAVGREFFLLRVDKLLDMGALEAARALLESGDLLDPELFRRWFDITLLTGTEHDACAVLRSQPSLAPTLPARVFCLARNGDWNAAALTLNTARALGDVTPEEDLLLSRFLDAEIAEPEQDMVSAARPSPLIYRLKEAVGDIIPTVGLPLAFSHADLRDTVAWRAQIEAAERLARHGALSEDDLLDFYTARKPAASGGVWDRALAVQQFEAAMSSAKGVEEALPRVWDAMKEVDLEFPFARLYGDALASVRLDGEAGALAHQLSLLSSSFGAVARARSPASRREEVWRAVATGSTEEATASDAPSAAVLTGFSDTALPPDLKAAIEEGRTGEALLRAVGLFQQGLDGDHGAVTASIATLRALGLEETAKEASLQFLLLGAER